MSVKENTFCSAMFGNILWPAISLPCYAHDSCHIDKKISFQISRDNETAINDNFLKHVALGNSPRPTASGCCQATCFRKLSLIVSYYHCLGILLLTIHVNIKQSFSSTENLLKATNCQVSESMLGPSRCSTDCESKLRSRI